MRVISRIGLGVGEEGWRKFKRLDGGIELYKAKKCTPQSKMSKRTL